VTAARRNTGHQPGRAGRIAKRHLQTRSGALAKGDSPAYSPRACHGAWSGRHMGIATEEPGHDFEGTEAGSEAYGRL